MTNIIRTFVDKRRKQTDYGAELKEQWQEFIEEHKQDTLNPDFISKMAEMYWPTPEKITDLRTSFGIDEDSAESYLLIMYNLTNGTFVEHIEKGCERFKGDETQMLEKGLMLPDLFKALMDILNAITTGRIKVKPKKAIQKLYFLFETVGTASNEAMLWHTVNEMKHISNGMMTF